MEFSPFTEGLGLGASLIIAIGAQNAFVLRQGLQRQHVFLSAAFCALADLVLICAGVFGLGALVRGQGWFLTLMTWGGAAFLGWYGLKAALRALRAGSLEAGGPGEGLSVPAVVGSLAAFTFLNPHVYLDTVLLLGGLGARHPEAERPWFVAGASTASVLWFFGLAYGARLLAPLFARALTWRILDGLIAAVMLTLAGALVVSGLSPS
ncbi:MAG TPA: LysE/ArgO family amino acid transporter [Spirochaetia bacterium]|jgi:L-lysine exporter family protein LysE/ArgO|nr:LysE/ArgO family amino acid transporter [Spirochaetia bacterium]